MIFTKQERNIILFVAAAMVLGLFWFLIRKFVLHCDRGSDVLAKTETAVQKQAEAAAESVEEASGTDTEELLSINSAGVKEIADLPYLGDTKAGAIVEYRTANGDFQSLEDLVKVSGIGEKLLEKIKPYVKL